MTESKTPQLYPAELPLRVFISSVMDDEMSPWRDEAHLALSDTKYMWPWTFEYTPASSEATDKNYLRHVREADAVLWLVGSKTTQPVVNEIHEALTNDRPLIVLRLKTATPDQTTKDLIAEVGLKAKYLKTTIEELRHAIAVSFGDEITRAWRSSKPSTDRPILLDALGRESRARALVRWQAAGLAKSEAIELADNMSIGYPADDIRPSTDRPLVVIVGEMGAGKSLAAERMMQQAIANSISDRDAPIPVWLEASSINGEDLLQTIQTKATGLGDLKRQGAFVVINGADEAGTGVANNILEGARLVTNAWPNILIVITSRPVMNHLQKEERSIIKPLTEDAAMTLVRQITGREIKNYGWPPSIKEAIKRPFWAIILGIRLRESNSQQLPQSKGELLRFLVSGSLPEKSEEVQTILRKLARHSTDRRDTPVPLAELSIGSSLPDLHKTGLVVEKDRMLSFATAILTQWFAAESLIRGEVSVPDLIRDPERLDLWRYAFIIAIGEMDWSGVCEILEPLVKKDIGFASGVMDEALREYAMPGEPVSSPPVKETGVHIRQAMAAFLEGIGPLANLMSMKREDGQPHQLGVRSDGGGLLALWRPQNDLKNDVDEIPPQVHILKPSGWGTGGWTRPTTDPAWPWRWAHHEIIDELKPLIEKLKLPVEAGPLFEEKVWQEAHAVLGVGSLHPGPFKIEDVKSRLSRFSPNASLMSGGEIFDLKSLRHHIKYLEDKGVDKIIAPWPEQDRASSGGFISNLYTDERQLERTRAVYEGAIQGYIELVERWFPNLKSRFQTYVTFPATLKGSLHPGRQPVMGWYFEPLAEGTSNVEIEISTKKYDYTDISVQLEKNYELLRTLRPEARQWISANYPQTSLMDVFHINPATQLAYDWLKDDLKRIGLI